MKNKSVTKQVKQTLLAIINPMSDLKFIYAKAVRPAIEKLRLLRGKPHSGSTSNGITANTPSFDQAVKESGKSVDELMRYYRNSRCFWWVLMVLAGGFAVILIFILLAAAYNLPLLRTINVAVTTLCIAGAAGFWGVKTAEATWHLWQLSVRRVSKQERGTFSDFWAENGGYRSVIAPFWKGVQK